MKKKIKVIIFPILLVVVGCILYNFINQKYGVLIKGNKNVYCEESLAKIVSWKGSGIKNLVLEADSLSNFAYKRTIFDADTQFCSYYDGENMIITQDQEIYSVTFTIYHSDTDNVTNLYNEFGPPDFIGYREKNSRNWRSLIWLDQGINLIVRLEAGYYDGEDPDCWYEVIRVNSEYLTYFEPSSNYMDFPLFLGGAYYTSNKWFFQKDDYERDPFTLRDFADSWDGEVICED